MEGDHSGIDLTLEYLLALQMYDGLFSHSSLSVVREDRSLTLRLCRLNSTEDASSG